MTKRFLVPISAIALTATGLLGAAQPSRFVGATVSGPPTSGDFQTGDFVVTYDGAIFVCTTAGSPGDWTGTGTAADLTNYVTVDTDQIITGAKRFEDTVQGATPTAAEDLVTKQYADAHGVYVSPTPPADPNQWGLWMNTSA